LTPRSSRGAESPVARGFAHVIQNDQLLLGEGVLPKTVVAYAFACLSLGVAAFALPAPAIAEVGGTYVLNGGGYSIEVKMEGDTLVVVEPNKTSPYAKQGDGTYQFTNPNNGITYGLRVIDDQTIEAFKPGSDDAPTRLTLLGSPGGGTTADVADSEKWEQLAQHYSDLIQSDPSNAQANSACAAVAMKRSVASKEEADSYAAQMVSMLQQMDASANPCPDVITSW